MIERVNGFKASDGKIFDNETDAYMHQIQLDLLDHARACQMDEPTAARFTRAVLDNFFTLMPKLNSYHAHMSTLDNPIEVHNNFFFPL